MPVIAWLASAALACEPLGPAVAQARAAVDDAEIEAARAGIDAAYVSLTCQSEVVATADLLALYRLDAITALAADDRGRAVYAVLRAAAVDPLSAIDGARDGPELAALFQTYAPALADGLVVVAVEDGGAVWVDGRSARSGKPVRVAKGEHLVQVEGTTGLASSVESLSSDRVFRTGVPAGASVSAPMPLPAPPPIAAPAPGSTRQIDVPSRVVWISGLALGVAGGAALAVGWQAEQAFLGDPYADAIYAGCERAEPCWSTGRTAAIRGDVQRIRVLYAAGYAVAGAGGVLFAGGATGALIRRHPTVGVAGVW